MITTPYNFVPPPKHVWIPDEPLPALDSVDPTLCTGWFEVTLTTLTPTYIRAGRPVDQPLHGAADSALSDEWSDFDHSPHKPYGTKEFFHHGDPSRPVIPGSEVRGVIRTIFTIITDSAFHTTMNQVSGFRSVGLPRPLHGFPAAYKKWIDEHVRAGFLFRRGDEWVTVSNDSAAYGGRGAARVRLRLTRTADHPWPMTKVTVTDPQHHTEGFPLADGSPGWTSVGIKAVAIHTGTVAGQTKTKLPAVLLPPNDAKRLTVPDAVRARYQEDLRTTERSAEVSFRKLPRTQDLPELPETFAECDLDTLIPCFYTTDGAGQLSQIGATPSMRYLIDPPTALQRVDDTQVIDPHSLDMASRVFGILGGQASRVSFSSFHPTSPAEFEDYQSPGIQLGPRPTAVTLYREASSESDLQQLGGPRGWKFYWHRDPAVRQPANTITDDARKYRPVIRPARSGTAFTGRVRFQNLTRLELVLLFVALSHAGDTKALHVGLARKFGFGSVRASIDNLILVRRHAAATSFTNRNSGLLQLEKPDLSTFVGKSQQVSAAPLNEDALDRLRRARNRPELKYLLEFEGRPTNSSTAEVGARNGAVDKEWTKRATLPTAIPAQSKQGR